MSERTSCNVWFPSGALPYLERFREKLETNNPCHSNLESYLDNLEKEEDPSLAHYSDYDAPNGNADDLTDALTKLLVPFDHDFGGGSDWEEGSLYFRPGTEMPSREYISSDYAIPITTLMEFIDEQRIDDLIKEVKSRDTEIKSLAPISEALWDEEATKVALTKILLTE